MIDLNVSAPVITISRLKRLRSREQDSFADKLLAILRQQFGGHAFETPSLTEAGRKIA